MNLAWLSLGALVVAMVVSCFSQLNVGVLALSLAWIVGVYLGHMSLNDVLGGFPAQLFLTLAGVTLLFTQAQLNGTLDRLAHAAVRLCRGNAGLIPVMFFLLACRHRLGRARQRRHGRDDGAHGDGRGRPCRHSAVPDGDHGRQRRAGRGAVPVRPHGHHRQRVDAEDRAGRLRVDVMHWRTWSRTRSSPSAATSSSAGCACSGPSIRGDAVPADATTFRAPRTVTLVVIGVVLFAVLFLEANIGMAAFTGAIVLATLRVADHEQAIRKMPWTPIVHGLRRQRAGGAAREDEGPRALHGAAGRHCHARFADGRRSRS